VLLRAFGIRSQAPPPIAARLPAIGFNDAETGEHAVAFLSTSLLLSHKGDVDDHGRSVLEAIVAYRGLSPRRNQFVKPR
jgi:hypothetical protein